MSNQIELKVNVVRKLHYNQDSMYGVYALKPFDQESSKKVKLNSYNNFVVSGNTPELIIGNTYDIIIEPSEHPKYGKGYSFVAVKTKKPTTVEEQKAYIRAMLKETQAEAIIQKYPNEKILDLMKEDKFDYSDIKGIKEKTYKKIKDYLFKNINIQEAIVELKDLKITFKAMKKLIDHFGSPEIVVQKVKENIYNLCEVNMFGFRKVDEYALNRGDSKTNKNRIIAALKYLLNEESNNGHVWINEKQLYKKLKELLQIDLQPIENTINILKEKPKEFYFEGERVALRKYYDYELQIKNKLIHMNKKESKTNIENIDEIIAQMETEGGFQYTDEQKRAIKLATQHNVFILNGKAGTGKSFTVNGILNVLKDYLYCCCALSGKAAKILSNHGLVSKTIHRMLEVRSDGKFNYNSKNRLPYDIVVLDEASMVNSYLFNCVISALKDDAKIIIVGDSGQLSAIGSGAVFEDLLKANVFPQQELTIIQRQASKSGILLTANTIRDGQAINDRYDYETRTYGELRDMVLIPVQNKEYIKDMVIDICKKYKNKDLMEFQVITGLKSKGDISVKKLNNELQAIFNDISKKSVKRGGYEYREGDKVIQVGNNYEAMGEFSIFEVFNGTLGIIEKIEFDSYQNENHKIWIRFEGIDELICYSKSELDFIELAYAITVHRSQGSTIQHVLFVFDYGSYMLLSRQFVYTGITRASKGCVMICQNDALHHALKVNTSGERRTFLYDLLVVS